MSIRGKAQFVFAPIKDKNNDGAESYAKIKDILVKLYESAPRFDVVKLPPPNDVISTSDAISNGIDYYENALGVGVPNNLNFWFQLTQLPKMLIPHFWKLPESEVEKKRMELIANDAWMVENLKRLAIEMHCTIFVNESYDNFAEGDYIYRVVPESGNNVKVEANPSGKLPDHCNALRKQHEAAELFFKKMNADPRYSEGEMNTKIYWGLY